MITTQYGRVYGIVATLFAALLFIVACDSKEEAPPAAPADAATQRAADGGRMASIDADGNIAPFGFASRKPVPVPELQPVAATAPAASADGSSVVFGTNCVACHGPDGKGVEGLGVNLVDSQLVDKSSAEELVVFLKNGRPLDAPDNVTGVPMPSFAWMSDADLAEVSNYLKTL